MVIWSPARLTAIEDDMEQDEGHRTNSRDASLSPSDTDLNPYGVDFATLWVQ